MCVYTYIYKLLRYKSQEHLPSLHWSKKHCEMGAFFPPASGLSICTEEPPSPDPGILSIIIPCGMSRINATYWSQLRWELYIPQEVLFVTPQALNLLMRPSMFLLQSTESKLLPVCLSRERNSSKANKNVQKKKSQDDFQIRPVTNWKQCIISCKWTWTKVGIPRPNCRMG